MPSGPSHQVPIPTASASGFELQAEPDVKPDAAEATLLEYMPDVPTSPAQTVSSHAPKEFPWQPISKHGLESVASALPSLAEATRRAEPQSDTTSKVAPVVSDWGSDRKSTRLNSSHGYISYAVFCLKKKKR